MIEGLTFGKITSLALVDAVNPCALAVLTLVLIAVLTHDPKNKKNVLLTGLAFVVSVYVLYMIYGLVIIQVFKTFVTAVDSIRVYLFKGLGALAILLGILNMKDVIWYKAGGLMTEMPMKLRPKLKKLIAKITSPAGAFVIGAFVTVFLLPCTIGPYLIASGILSAMEFFKTLPWLMYYNILFVLPMLAITLVIYIGFTTVEKVGGWKDKNIRWLHLMAGIILFLLGLGMLVGWIH